MANLHFYALKYGEGEKGLFMGPKFFRGKLVQPRKVSVATGNLRTVSDTVGLSLATECVVEAGSWISRMAMNEVFEI